MLLASISLPICHRRYLSKNTAIRDSETNSQFFAAILTILRGFSGKNTQDRRFGRLVVLRERTKHDLRRPGSLVMPLRLWHKRTVDAYYLRSAGTRLIERGPALADRGPWRE